MNDSQLKAIILTILWVQEKAKHQSLAEFSTFLQRTSQEVEDLMQIGKQVVAVTEKKGWGKPK